jgi:hypothetical protein
MLDVWCGMRCWVGVYCVCKLNSCARGVSVVGTKKKQMVWKEFIFVVFFLCAYYWQKSWGLLCVCVDYIRVHAVCQYQAQKKKQMLMWKEFIFVVFFLKKRWKIGTSLWKSPSLFVFYLNIFIKLENVDFKVTTPKFFFFKGGKWGLQRHNAQVYCLFGAFWHQNWNFPGRLLQGGCVCLSLSISLCMCVCVYFVCPLAAAHEHTHAYTYTHIGVLGILDLWRWHNVTAEKK